MDWNYAVKIGNRNEVASTREKPDPKFIDCPIIPAEAELIETENPNGPLMSESKPLANRDAPI